MNILQAREVHNCQYSVDQEELLEDITEDILLMGGETEVYAIYTARDFKAFDIISEKLEYISDYIFADDPKAMETLKGEDGETYVKMTLNLLREIIEEQNKII